MKFKEREYISEIDRRPKKERFYYLSTEERTELQETLKSYEKPKVELFIRSVEFYLTAARQIIDHLNLKSRSKERNELIALRRRLEVSYEDILGICSGRFKILPPYQCDLFYYEGKEPKTPRESIRRNIIIEAVFIRQHIEEIIRDLRLALDIERPSRRGRFQADEFRLATQIARAFNRFIGMPRPHSGPFTEICEYCFDIVGIRGDDRTRAIRQALRNISSS